MRVFLKVVFGVKSFFKISFPEHTGLESIKMDPQTVVYEKYIPLDIQYLISI